MSEPTVTMALPPELVEALARRVAELLVERHDLADLVLERRGDNGDGGYLNVAGAAAFLACPVSRIYALTSSKRLPVHRDGSRLLFDRSELRAYVDSGGARRP